jgi:hypothetical protein
MLSVRGIYEGGQVKLLEPVSYPKRARVIVTIVEEMEDAEPEKRETDMNAFDDLVGMTDTREDGSVTHDQYLCSEDC